MLVLSRQRDESIIIGDNIVVTIVDIRGDKVRLGINAPTEIPVHRQRCTRPSAQNSARPGWTEGCPGRGQRRGERPGTKSKHSPKWLKFRSALINPSA